VSQIRHHAAELDVGLDDQDRRTMAATYELTEFLVKHLGVTDLGARFPHRVALHKSCHGLRELGLGAMSERRDGAAASPAEVLLGKVAGLSLVTQDRADECCGFGGTFAVSEARLSARMGEDRCAAIAAAGAEYFTGTDASCLMHLDGIAVRQGGLPRSIHIAEILACR
jgi:L-lactate dehydrogenase complex protein LldE